MTRTTSKPRGVLPYMVDVGAFREVMLISLQEHKLSL
jgi:hypothetical protein